MLGKKITMKRCGTILLVVLIIAGGANPCGATEKFSLDKDRTYVGFSVSYLVLARVNGRFDAFKGFFIIDREHPENSRADIVIQTASVDTGFEARDADIRGPGLFNADRYPTMVFHSNKIEMGPDNTGQITGDLTLLGTTKPVTLTFVKGPEEGRVFKDGFKATGKIKRSDFGMNAFIKPIGNVVTLLVCYNMVECSEDNQNKIQPRYNQ